jgi:predicted RNase H-like nuclease (RuvC/YqgF family)
MYNEQETLELQYFQRIQVQKLEISTLKIEIGKLKAEIDHLNYLLEKVHEPATNAEKWKRKYDHLFLQLKNFNP